MTTCRPKGQATQTLQADGFKVKAEKQDTGDKKQDGIVLSQSPAAGTQADIGSAVTIVVGKYKKGTAPAQPAGGANPAGGALPWAAPLVAVAVPRVTLGRRRARRR